MKKVMMLEITQPIGTFYVGKMAAKDIVDISCVSQRKGDHGHQRQLKERRIKEISMYCKDPDATFPTPIIISVNKDDFQIVETPVPGFVCFEFDERKKCAEILDGQHRIAGIAKCGSFIYELPIIVMFDLREEQKAYVFSTINGNQVKVDKSLIYDLFDLNDTPSPYKTCHHIARALNSDPQSPFYQRLKMLEKREFISETISQSTFVTNLCALISTAPQEDAILLKQKKQLIDSNDGKTVLRKYFIGKRDDVILKILINYFSAVANVFEKEWKLPQKYVLTKTVGFTGLVYALKELVPQGEKNNDLSKDFFSKIFIKLRERMILDNVEFTSESFPSSAQSANKIAKMIVDVSKSE